MAVLVRRTLPRDTNVLRLTISLHVFSKDRTQEAFAILTKYHAAGDAHDPFVQSEMAEIHETIRLEKLRSKNGWQVFFQTKGNRKRLALIALTAFFSQCSGNGNALNTATSH
jgi:hypothetical protein